MEKQSCHKFTYSCQLKFKSCFRVNVQTNLCDTVFYLAVLSSFSPSSLSLTRSPASSSLGSRFHHLAVEGREGVCLWGWRMWGNIKAVHSLNLIFYPDANAVDVRCRLWRHGWHPALTLVCYIIIDDLWCLTGTLYSLLQRILRRQHCFPSSPFNFFFILLAGLIWG